jgi:hypothetical protein
MPDMMRLPLGGLVLFAGLASAGCIGSGHSCTAIGFLSQTTIVVESANNAWVAGTYTLAVTADGGTIQCTMMVTAAALASPDSVSSSCDANTINWGLSPICPQPPPVCNATGCEQMGSTANCLPGQFTMNVTLPGVTSPVALALSLDGAVVLSQNVDPDVKTVEPNGPGCGTASSASATLSIADGGLGNP